MRQNKSFTRWLRPLPRIFVGLVLIGTGIGKLLDMGGFVSVLDAYQLLPPWMSILVAYSLPFIELGTGICLLIGIHVGYSASIAVGLHIMMLSVVTLTLQRGITVANCGCFGVFLARPLTIQILIEDSFMLGISTLALLEAKRTVLAKILISIKCAWFDERVEITSIR